MKLLVFTQALDLDDPILSVYHQWVLKISEQFESVIVICLKKGRYSLPAHVRVLSLGKEEGKSRLSYVKSFYTYIFSEKNNYDAVFVHMNQEYVLLGGLFWKVWGKKVTMWRNHHAGTILTDIAAAFCSKIFCTSKFSYTAKYKKTILMPVGIDTQVFRKLSNPKNAASILFLARIAPVKKPHVLIEALKILKAKHISFNAHIFGDPLPKDEAYFAQLKESTKDLGSEVSFHKGVPNRETVNVYNAHEIFVNLSSSGMYDKTIFEAMACETLTLASNENLKGVISDDFIFEEGNVANLALKLEKLLALSKDEKEKRGQELRNIVAKHHSLSGLVAKLKEAISAE